MEEQSLFYFISFSSFLSLLLFFILKTLIMKQGNKIFPPSPPSWPIIGHLHLLKEPLHRCLQDLSYTYGSIFKLKLGSVVVIVISSPQHLEECFVKNDLVFANRPNFLFGKHLGYNNSALAFSSYGPHWRNLRRMLTIEFFSNNRLNEYMALRKEELVLLVKDIYSVSSSGTKTVEMKFRLLELSFNVVMRMATGKRYFGAVVEDLEEAERFRGIIGEIFEMSGADNPSDFLTFLQWVDLKGFEKKMVKLQKRSDAFLQRLVDGIRSQRKATGTKGQNSRTLIDKMMALQESEPEHYTDDIIKGSISTVLLAGTDTSSSTTEWAISLLLNHPEVLEKARAEIDIKIGHDHLVNESDLSKLPYLQCVVNETLRLFPVSPLLGVHMSSEDCVVGGFNIPRGTLLMANAWALHRDPDVWDDPTSFKPERFEGAQIEACKFAPFGMGRRKCPGAGLANRVVNHSLAALIQCFEWERLNEELVDLSESKGLTMPKKKPLEVLLRPREEMINVLSKL